MKTAIFAIYSPSVLKLFDLFVLALLYVVHKIFVARTE